MHHSAPRITSVGIHEGMCLCAHVCVYMCSVWACTRNVGTLIQYGHFSAPVYLQGPLLVEWRCSLCIPVQLCEKSIKKCYIM